MYIQVTQLGVGPILINASHVTRVHAAKTEENKMFLYVHLAGETTPLRVESELEPFAKVVGATSLLP